MKTSTKKILLILTFSLFLLSFSCFLFDFVKIKEYFYSFILGVTFIFSVILLGYNKNRNSKEKNMTVILLVFSLFFQIFVFVILGLKLGFLRSSYTLGFSHLFKIVLPNLIILFLSELLRYQVVEKGRNNKIILIYITFFFIFLDFLIGTSFYSIRTFKGLFELSAIIVFPSIMKNVLLTYTVYHYGYKPTLIYRLIMEIPMYYLPITPDIGDYLNSVLNILFPFFLFLYILFYTSHTDVSATEEVAFDKFKKSRTFILNGFLLFVLVLYICLMSGVFQYYFLVIGSGSMEPNLFVGDMVLVEKIDKYENLKNGDVLVFNHNNKVMIHRIVEIKNENEQFSFKTKGDNNEVNDNWDVLGNEVIGKVNFKLKGLGYPTIWLSNLFKGES